MKNSHVPHWLAVSILFFTLTGCATQRPPMYMWETFPKLQYELLLREGVSPTEQIQRLEAHVQKAKATNAELPPGLRAHLGMLHLNSGQVDLTRELWLEEKAAFPESAPYIDYLLKRLDGAIKIVKTEKIT
jgi:hypothetical protein